MTVLPRTTPKLKPTAIFMSQTSAADAGPSAATPTSSALPIPSDAAARAETGSSAGGSECTDENEAATDFKLPKLRLELRDLNHAGTRKFLHSVDATQVFADAVRKVLRWLYVSPDELHTHAPPTRSVTLVLREMDGVAYTVGTELDSEHKEIHFSLRYIDSIHPPSRLASEITGILVHEMVHCYQWTGKSTCPGGLIEGIADWVRLSCDLSPPHWKKEMDGEWDRGYQHTAYFLEYLEERFGTGTVRRLNEKLRHHKYKTKAFWTELLGGPVEQLWCDYVKMSNKDKGAQEKTENLEKGDPEEGRLEKGPQSEPTDHKDGSDGPRK